MKSVHHLGLTPELFCQPYLSILNLLNRIKVILYHITCVVAWPGSIKKKKINFLTTSLVYARYLFLGKEPIRVDYWEYPKRGNSKMETFLLGKSREWKSLFPGATDNFFILILSPNHLILKELKQFMVSLHFPG